MATIIDGTTGSSIAGNTTVTGNLTVTGSITAGAGAPYVFNAYTSPTTWDATAKKAAGLKSIKVTVVGAGGTGGGAVLAAPGNSGAGTGGGGGGAVIEYVPVSNITPGTKTVTAGAGTNSFGPWGTATPNSPTATASATAGSTGGNGVTPSTPSTTLGAGGVGSGGTLTFDGTPGSQAVHRTIDNRDMGGSGGASAIFGAPIPSTVGVNINGIAATIDGGGGAGSPYRSVAGTSTGGAGAPGVVIIEEFY
jgi:hypothetical protein